MTQQREVGVGLLGARLEALEHVGDVDGKRNLPTPHSFGSTSVPDGPR